MFYLIWDVSDVHQMYLLLEFGAVHKLDYLSLKTHYLHSRKKGATEKNTLKHTIRNNTDSISLLFFQLV